ncbi:MAG: translation initiation factor IF-2 [Endomicrobiales bacterium]|nr:translation initiation factor IF-2 [Endomicrobiales bacterium]
MTEKKAKEVKEIKKKVTAKVADTDKKTAKPPKAAVAKVGVAVISDAKKKVKKTTTSSKVSSAKATVAKKTKAAVQPKKEQTGEVIKISAVEKVSAKKKVAAKKEDQSVKPDVPKPQEPKEQNKKAHKGKKIVLNIQKEVVSKPVKAVVVDVATPKQETKKAVPRTAEEINKAVEEKLAELNAPKNPAEQTQNAPEIEEEKKIKKISINETITVRILAEKMNQKPVDVLKKLLTMGSLATINQKIDTDTAELLATEFGYEVSFVSLYEDEAEHEVIENPAKLLPRAPVVTIMGHVDHGKTSLLDAIRKSNIAGGEAGGITQHIGAYKVKTAKGEIAFLDTPGHEAFTAMRSRGAKATDLVVLVVSATDGVMPQTIEAIDHAKAANVPIIVAINKIDLPGANPEQIKQELSKYKLVPEDWGGDTITINVSAKKSINIDLLLEMILLKAELMELKADPNSNASGVVIEAKLDPRRGQVATVLIQRGTLKVGDNFVIGNTYGKVRAMQDEHGIRMQSACPSTPVEVLGITSTPQSGDKFVVVESERIARDIAQTRASKIRENHLRPLHHLSLEDVSAGKIKDLRIVVKGDVQGSIEAIRDSLERFPSQEINLRIIHCGVGNVNESDVMLAAASDALVIGFNVKLEPAAERIAEHEGVSVRNYKIIYDLIADVKAAMEGMLEPEIKEVLVGKAQVRQVFKASKIGTIAGSMVLEGKIIRGATARVMRDGVIIHEGSIVSLKRFKDDAKEVEKGYECGIGISDFIGMKVDDVIEVFEQKKVARKLAE